MVLNDVAMRDLDRASLLAASPLFNAQNYASQVGIPTEEAALHYVTSGWKLDLEPLAGVETAFFRSYFESAGWMDPPAITWLELSSMGVFPPRTRAKAEYLANEVRKCVDFDAAYYSENLNPDLDPALHYAIIGESIGRRPSPSFDPAYYLERNPDCAAFLVDSRLLVHFERHGRTEGRQPTSISDDMVFDPLPWDPRPAILVISHEASRTGAPILGWNLIRQLSKKCRVVSVLLRGGDLEEDFRAAAAASTTPLTWNDWQPVEMRRVAQRLVSNYRPLYAIANSIETQILVPPLVKLGVPVISLIHEFASYTRPRSKLANVFDWASQVVFSAQMVADSSLELVTGLNARSGIHVLRQGRCDIPGSTSTSGDPTQDDSRTSALEQLRPAGRENAFVIMGAGSVQLRKGVELFVATAAAARRLRPDLPLLFVWVGDGFDPVNDLAYSIYLDEQIKRSNLGDSLIMRDAVKDLDNLYRQTDVFLLSSRLDPQPNVAIDATNYGIPTVCFEGAAGTAEVLGADPATQGLVVPHLDAHAAAEVICRIASQRETIASLRNEVARVSRTAFDMPAYIARVDELGRQAARQINPQDLATLVESGAVDPTLFFGPGEEWLPRGEMERAAILQWALWNGIEAQKAGIEPERPFRRSHEGFHPTIYALAHRAECIEGGRDPLAHWVGAGKPSGPWSHRVYGPEPAQATHGQRVALHVHFHYPELVFNLLWRLQQNHSAVDLFLTTGTKEKAEQLKDALKAYKGNSDVRITPNRGRDSGPFLTELAPEILRGGYDVFGHVHAKRSLAIDPSMGERWRDFLWENLVGGRYAMLDTAAVAFANDPSLGVLMAEDPHIVGWNQNRKMASELASRMGITEPLPDCFEFPLGTMFIARAAALRPLVELGLSWPDYPEEPLPDDGTLLHAIERVVPFAARHAGFGLAGLRVPGTNW